MATNNAWNSTPPLVVGSGYTGDSTLTANAVLCAGTTTTNPVQSIASVGTLGQLLTSNGAAALPTFQDNPTTTGSIILIKTLTASSSASLEFTSLMSGYRTYLVVGVDLYPGTDAVTLGMTWSTNNGTSYLSSGYLGGATSVSSSSATQVNLNSTSLIPMHTSVMSTGNTGRMLNFNLWLYTMNTADVASCDGFGIHTNSTGTRSFQIVGFNTGTTAINAIKFATSSGNIASGSIMLYGVKQ